MQNDEKQVLDENEGWSAVINRYDDTLCLGFETEDGEPIQGNIDDTIEEVFDADPQIDDVEIDTDDGFCLAYFGDCPLERQDETIARILEFFRQSYFANKERFAESIRLDLEDYED